jgi:hypothetical protein
MCYRSRRPKPQQNVAMGGKRIFSAPPNLRNSSEGNSLRKVGDNLSAARISTPTVAQSEKKSRKTALRAHVASHQVFARSA